jgi:ectoine hydroxylase-related dioxygenase (phytanoyl-CoA dioxygenase family)
MTTAALSTPYELDEDAPSRLNEQGFVKLKGVISPDDIASYEPEITQQVIRLNTMHLPMSERSTYDRAFLQVENLWQHSDKVRELVFGTRLARLAADLLGVDSVRLYHDQALYKESGGGITPWHADQYYWPLSSDRTCTIWIPLQETPMEMGPLAFSAGSNRVEVGRDLPISDKSDATIQAALEAARLPLMVEPFELGEVSFHLGWTFHRASPNLTATPRRVMTIIYMDASITLREPQNANQASDARRWMPGTEVGAVPDTPLNPILYQRGS